MVDVLANNFGAMSINALVFFVLYIFQKTQKKCIQAFDVVPFSQRKSPYFHTIVEGVVHSIGIFCFCRTCREALKMMLKASSPKKK